MNKGDTQTAIGPIPQWLWDWTGEHTECSCCGTGATRADEDGLSLCCGTAIMLQVDDTWKMVRDLARAQIRREVVESLCKITRPGYPSDFLRETDLRAWLAEQEANDGRT